MGKWVVEFNHPNYLSTYFDLTWGTPTYVNLSKGLQNSIISIFSEHIFISCHKPSFERQRKSFLTWPSLALPDYWKRSFFNSLEFTILMFRLVLSLLGDWKYCVCVCRIMDFFPRFSKYLAEQLMKKRLERRKRHLLFCFHIFDYLAVDQRLGVIIMKI